MHYSVLVIGNNVEEAMLPFHYKANDGQEFYCKNLWWNDFFSSLDTVDYTPVTVVERE